jgi:RND family efflux transporter MFP subunit
VNASRRLPLLAALVLVLVGGGSYLLGRLGTTSNPPDVAQGHEEAEAHAEEAGGIRFTPESLRLAGIEVREARADALRGRLPLNGQVAPDLAGVARVTPRVAGKVTAVLANVGDSVVVGQRLATVASTELAEAQAAYRQAQARRALTADTLARQRRLARLGTFGRGPLEESQTKEIEARQLAEEAEHHRETSEAEVNAAAREIEARVAAERQAATELDVAQRARDRARTLFGEQIVSRQDYERAEADVRLREQALAAARANTEKARAAHRSATVVAEAADAEHRLALQKAEVQRRSLERERNVAASGLRTNREVAEAEGSLRQAELDVRAAADAVRLLGGTPGGGNVVAVTAPIAGRITERTVTLGETVTADRSLFAVLNARTVWVELTAHPRDLAKLRTGQPVSVRAPSVPGTEYRGTIASLGDVVDAETRTAKVRCVIANPDGRLKPGMFVAGQVLGKASASSPTALTIPADAVQEWEGRRVVFVAGDEPGEFRPVPVETGEEAGGFVEVRSGLKAGDRYVAKNALMVKAQAMKGELGHEH